MKKKSRNAAIFETLQAQGYPVHSVSITDDGQVTVLLEPGQPAERVAAAQRFGESFQNQTD